MSATEAIAEDAGSSRQSGDGVSLSEALHNAKGRLEQTLRELENVQIHNACLTGAVETMHNVIQELLPADASAQQRSQLPQQTRLAWEGFKRGCVL